MLVGHPMHRAPDMTPVDAGAPSIPSIESAQEQGPGDDLFREPEAQPKFVTAGTPPEAALRGHHSVGAATSSDTSPLLRQPLSSARAQAVQPRRKPEMVEHKEVVARFFKPHGTPSPLLQIHFEGTRAKGVSPVTARAPTSRRAMRLTNVSSWRVY
jgi:hypothetical protein